MTVLADQKKVMISRIRKAQRRHAALARRAMNAIRRGNFAHAKVTQVEAMDAYRDIRHLRWLYDNMYPTADQREYATLLSEAVGHTVPVLYIESGGVLLALPHLRCMIAVIREAQ